MECASACAEKSSSAGESTGVRRRSCCGEFTDAFGTAGGRRCLVADRGFRSWDVHRWWTEREWRSGGSRFGGGSGYIIVIVIVIVVMVMMFKIIIL